MTNMRLLTWIFLAVTTLAVSCKKDSKQTLAVLSTVAATSITSTTATTGGTITGTGGSSISSSGVTYALHSNPSITDSLVPSSVTGTGSFSSSLINLNANTLYYVRAYAVNGTGTAYGDQISFTTAAGLATITTTAISNNGDLKAQSGGNIINDGGSPITARGIVWSTSPHPTSANYKTSDSTGKGVFVDSLTNLSLTTYYVRAYATNSSGTAYGNEISFMASSSGTISDIDGNVYATVVIGSQTWMGSNLRVTHYRNGDKIQDGSAPNFNWVAAPHTTSEDTVGAFTYPNDDSSNNSVYGKYYNDPAVNDDRGACPLGWHVPTLGDWETLEYNQGASASDTVNNGAFNGNIGGRLLLGGSSGLNLQEAGFLLFNGYGTPASYQLIGPGNGAIYWTGDFAGTYPNDGAGNWYLGFDFSGTGPIYTSNGPLAASVRCIKN